MKILSIVGGRPNFIKIMPLIREMKEKHILVHTGQHYDFKMSEVFFKELNIPSPDYNLGVGSGSNLFQTAEVMKRLEPIILKEKPDLVLVVGDINSSLAGALAAAKLHIPLAHVEAGLRSFNMEMQEEINRVLIDHIAYYLFTTEESGNNNLIKEGISKDKIHFVGNVMIDTLMSVDVDLSKKEEYAVLTLHRAENVDNEKTLRKIIDTLKELNIKIVWPLHPRTKKRIEEFGLDISSFETTESKSYIDFISLVKGAKFVLTDSGGVQEETTFLNIPCLTLREDTERPVTIKKGTNILVGSDKEKILAEVEKIIKGEAKKKEDIELWDGKAAQRIIKILCAE